MDLTLDTRFDLADATGEFQGLTLDLTEALRKRDELSSAGRRLLVVPVHYRDSSIREEQARQVAEAELRGRGKAYHVDLASNPIRLISAHPMGFIFELSSPLLGAEERIPGSLRCMIDRVDGHVWGPDEMESYLLKTGQAHK